MAFENGQNVNMQRLEKGLKSEGLAQVQVGEKAQRWKLKLQFLPGTSFITSQVSSDSTLTVMMSLA